MFSSRSLTIDYAILCGASICTIASLVGSIASDEVVWFQRSGSIVVLLAVVLEIRQTLATQPQEDFSVTIGGQPVLKKRPISDANARLHWLARFGIVVGTLVWGYGDLMLGAVI